MTTHYVNAMTATPLEVIKTMVREDGKMLDIVHMMSDASWPEVGHHLYGQKLKNFDMFKTLIHEGMITQTDETKSTKTRAGSPKFLFDSLSPNARYRCTQAGHELIERARQYEQLISFCRQAKDVRRSSMSMSEYSLTQALAGNDTTALDALIREGRLPDTEGQPLDVVNYVNRQAMKISCQDC